MVTAHYIALRYPRCDRLCIQPEDIESQADRYYSVNHSFKKQICQLLWKFITLLLHSDVVIAVIHNAQNNNNNNIYFTATMQVNQ